MKKKSTRCTAPVRRDSSRGHKAQNAHCCAFCALWRAERCFLLQKTASRGRRPKLCGGRVLSCGPQVADGATERERGSTELSGANVRCFSPRKTARRGRDRDERRRVESCDHKGTNNAHCWAFFALVADGSMFCKPGKTAESGPATKTLQRQSFELWATCGRRNMCSRFLRGVTCKNAGNIK